MLTLLSCTAEGHGLVVAIPVPSPGEGKEKGEGFPHGWHLPQTSDCNPPPPASLILSDFPECHLPALPPKGSGFRNCGVVLGDLLRHHNCESAAVCVTNRADKRKGMENRYSF